jgi:hypothetical protein
MDRNIDRLIDRLPELRVASPRPSRDAAVRARCHAVLGAAHGARKPRSRLARTIDAGLTIAIGLYGIAVVAEALRLVLR